ncbi:permease-like cell division protein FtsX [Propionivibrio limicola]|uniref:permease-like cell division protein FtsX n=1 Tax=Propionivibrio limicola TaxID=167645 RepID=UPI001290ED96|nr:permease-like cell division protein FtsX [Propionivibrio limicola]
MMTFLAQHGLALRSALRRLVASPLNTVLSLMVIGAALALPSAGWIVLDNVQDIAGNISGTQQISLFMAVDAGRKDTAEIEARLKEAKVGKWRFVPKEEALKNLQATEGMNEIVASLPRNPLPDAFVVEPADTRPESLEELAKTAAGWPKVAHVQLDSAWIKRLDLFLRIGKLTVTLLASLFAGALVAVTFNTIRLQILAQADEIEVAKLIGATDAYVSRPFLYFGAVQGVLGGLFATVLLMAAGYVLAPPVGELIELYGGGFALQSLSAANIAVIAAIGGGLGWLGAQLSVTIYLRRIA